MIECHTMSRSKIAITLDERTLRRLDRLVRAEVFDNRSRAIEKAVEEKLERLEGDRLAEECSKLDPGFEQAMADEGLSEELGAWPEY